MKLEINKSDIFANMTVIHADIDGLNHVMDMCEKAKVGLFRDDDAASIRFMIGETLRRKE